MCPPRNPARTGTNKLESLTSEAASGWRTKAACLGTDPKTFFPVESTHGGKDSPTYITARKICATCPVRITCLTYAVETRQHYGVWGGLTPNERRHLIKGGPIRFDIPADEHGLETTYNSQCRCFDCVIEHADRMIEDNIQPKNNPPQETPDIYQPSLYDI